MTYTIKRRVPHTSAVFRSEHIYTRKCDALFVWGMLNIVAPGLYIRHVERF